jgi:hypothetical protein
MIDPRFAFLYRFVEGVDAIWFSRDTWALLTPEEIGFDDQDVHACMLRCEVAVYLCLDEERDDDEEGPWTARYVCAYPVQCGALAAYDVQGRLVCLEHQAKEPA